MDFARKQLQKYGWSEGKGLGKHENGISEALKPKLKRSVAGIGHDAAADFTEHWWSALYDKAASNVQVKEKNGTTKKISTKNSEEFEITSSTWKIKRKKMNVKSDQYADFFVKKAVLSNGGSKTEKIGESDSEEVEKKDVLKMTDEELFIACGGRTAHKGARHGLKCLGKLARIEQQENMLLNEPRFEGYSHKKVKKKEIKLDSVVEDLNLNSDKEDDVKHKKKGKKKYCTNIPDDQINIETSSLEPLATKKKRKKAHKNETGEIDLVQGNLRDNVIENICTDLPKIKTKKKKRKDNPASMECETDTCEIEQNIKIFKKKKQKVL